MSNVVYLPNKKKKIKSKKGLVYLLILISILIFVKSVWSITTKTIKTQVLELEVVTTKFLVDAIFIKDEDIVKSPIKGNLSFSELKEGERVRVGQEIAIIDFQSFEGIQKQVVVTTSQAGIISLAIDGFEETLKGKGIGELDLSELKKMDFNKYFNDKKDSRAVEEGTPIFKLISPFSDLNFIIYLPQKELADSGIDPFTLKDLPLTMENNGKQYQITILDVGFADEDVFFSGKFLRDKEDFYSSRKTQLELIVDSIDGYYVPLQAVVMVNDDAGVYVQKNKTYTWVPVDILKTFDDKYFIQIEDNEYPVVINPQNLHNKQEFAYN